MFTICLVWWLDWAFQIKEGRKKEYRYFLPLVFNSCFLHKNKYSFVLVTDDGLRRISHTRVTVLTKILPWFRAITVEAERTLDLPSDPPWVTIVVSCRAVFNRESRHPPPNWVFSVLYFYNAIICITGTARSRKDRSPVALQMLYRVCMFSSLSVK